MCPGRATGALYRSAAQLARVAVPSIALCQAPGRPRAQGDVTVPACLLRPATSPQHLRRACICGTSEPAEIAPDA